MTVLCILPPCIVYTGVTSPKSPLVKKNSTPLSKTEPMPYLVPTSKVPTSTLVDVEARPSGAEGAGQEAWSPRNKPDSIHIGDVQALSLDTPGDQYVSMTRTSTLSPTHQNILLNQQDGGAVGEGGTGGVAPPELSDAYVMMQSCSAKTRSASITGSLGLDNATPSPDRSHSSPSSSRPRATSDLFSPSHMPLPPQDEEEEDNVLEEVSSYINHHANHHQHVGSPRPRPRPRKTSASVCLSSTAAHYDVPRPVNAVAGGHAHSTAGVSHAPTTSSDAAAPFSPDHGSSSLLDQLDPSTADPLLPAPLVPTSTPSPTKSSQHLGDPALHPSPSSSSSKAGQRTSVPLTSAELDMLTHDPRLGQAAATGAWLYASGEEPLVPQSTRYLYSTPRSAVNSSWSGTKFQSYRPIPKPRTTTNTDLSKSVGGGELPISSSSLMAGVVTHSPPVPPARKGSLDQGNTSSESEGNEYQMLSVETISNSQYTELEVRTRSDKHHAEAERSGSRPAVTGGGSGGGSSHTQGDYQMLSMDTMTTTAANTYMQVNSHTRTAHGSRLAGDEYETLDPRATKNDDTHGVKTPGGKGVKASKGVKAPKGVKTPPSRGKGKRPTSAHHKDKERLLEEILEDEEFAGCEVEICKFALEQQGYDMERAREEIRVQILLGMLLPNIREEDCRRALVHCQHKTDRAATWLLQRSEEIQSRTQ